MLQVTPYGNAGPFLDRTQSLLEQHEAANNLILGLADIFIRTPDRYPDKYLLTVDDESGVQAIALWTLPAKLVVYAVDPASAAVGVLARYFFDQKMSLPGVIGQTATARAFADVWTALVGGTTETVFHMGVYELRKLIPPPQVEGQMVLAGREHRSTLAEWVYAFQHEALATSISLDAARQIADRHIEQRTLWFWMAGDQPVSMAANHRQTRHGGVIGLVYTPTEQRGRGYASAVTAALSQHILDSGKDFCALFTNLANPTSNHLYQTIGYCPVDNFDELKFDRFP